MGTDWKNRLREVIKAQGSSLRALSGAANVGPNYVQQILKDDKDSGFTRLARVLAVLGPEATVYVTSGDRITADTHLRAALMAYGVKDENDIATVVALAKRLSSQTAGDKQQQTPSHDQSATEIRRHESRPAPPR